MWHANIPYFLVIFIRDTIEKYGEDLKKCFAKSDEKRAD